MKKKTTKEETPLTGANLLIKALTMIVDGINQDVELIHKDMTARKLNKYIDMKDLGVRTGELEESDTVTVDDVLTIGNYQHALHVQKEVANVLKGLEKDADELLAKFLPKMKKQSVKAEIDIKVVKGMDDLPDDVRKALLKYLKGEE